MRLSIKDVRTERKLLWIFEMFLKHNAGKCILIIEFMWLFLYYFILYILYKVKKLFIIVQQGTRKKEYFK